MTGNEIDALTALERSVRPEAMIQALLQVLPDTTVAIQDRQARTARYLEAILGNPVSAGSIKVDPVLDGQLGAIAERLPMPRAGAQGEQVIGPEAGKLWIHHPLGGAHARSRYRHSMMPRS